MNRQLVGRLASYHFAAAEHNRLNLLQEHVPEGQIAVVGNTVIDALYHVTSLPVTFPPELNRLFKKGKKMILLTTHRRENLDRLGHVYQAIKRLISEGKMFM
jgi:UDP-N-acetylglucosamine 2-epimerase (non-hydrolysing)